MRTLLIDNYDSYTFNLFQLIAEVNGELPHVVRNNQQRRWVELDDFDNVVISPGPGHPSRAGDFGICADVIANTTLPLLGVCLGHQGIVTAAGGEVVTAPRARHGYLSKVTHDGGELFADLPRVFTAVRYHSLCAREPLPPSLLPTAWAEDGVVMGVRHRDRPLWGLQFHPESVATEFGLRMLRNFAALTAARRPGRPPARRSPRRTATRTAGPIGASNAERPTKRYHLRVRTLDRAVDTDAAFSSLFAGSDHSFWLDSAHVEPGLARFSHLGDGTGPCGEVVRYRVGEGAVTVEPSRSDPRRVAGTIFHYLRAELDRREIISPELPFDYSCGYVGYFGYELKADCGATNAHRADLPDAQWIFADRSITVDHQHGRTYVMVLDDGSSEGREDASRRLAEMVAVVEKLPGHGAATARATTQRATASTASAVEPWLDRDRLRYLADVQACQAKLREGESYEICLTNAARVPDTEGGLAYYRKLRSANPAPYGAYLRFGGTHIACSSPERFLRIDRNRVVETKPIKGTSRRGRTAEEDERLREELTTSRKTYAENLMIVDLLRNDLGRVCDVSSVHVPRLMVTETYATVHQLVSTIRGRLRADASAIDCVQACFPGGSMTGAPKPRTMEIIDSLEQRARGVYSGSIGFLGCDGTADLNIVIRTAVLNEGVWHVGAGGAIVLDSDPADEYDEMLLKAASALRAHPVLDGTAERGSTPTA